MRFLVENHRIISPLVAALFFMRAALGDDAKSQPENFSPSDLEFFESRIRPVLVTHCYECHSEEAAKKNRLRGGLRVDSRDGLLRGGDSGASLTPNQPADSLLLKALLYEELQMPPKGKLPPDVIRDFENWIAKGAADPRRESGESKMRTIDLQAGRQHWAYQPIRKPSVPEILTDASIAKNQIDSYLASELSRNGLSFAPEAERRTIVRRAYFDLVGLPPTPEEIEEFLADDRPDAYERLVDRLISSPHFGVRWGRRWLSVVRFAESLTLRGLVFTEAWRYRDYVIDAFNEDRPFDQFIVEQIAGDLLPADTLIETQRRQIATTFLTLGNLNLEEQDKKQLRMDVVDEQLDAIGKGFLAQTIGCARCHDHKFDPIPTRDYYALAGILANVKTLEDANVSKWIERPLAVDPEFESILSQNDATVAQLQSRIKSLEETHKRRSNVVAIKDLPGVIVDDRQAKLVGDWQTSVAHKPYVGQGYIHDQNTGKGDKTATLQPDSYLSGRYDVRLAYSADSNRADDVPITVFSADGEQTVHVNQKRKPPIDAMFVSLGQFRFEEGGQCFVIVSTEGTKGHVIVDAIQFLPIDAAQTSSSSDAPVAAKTEPNAAPRDEAHLEDELKSLKQQLSQLQSTGPKRPKSMSVQEEPKIADIKVHVRGSVHNQTETVPRGFLQVTLRGEAAPLPSSQSGRVELGEWIASRDNPLTARVAVNRIWYWLFGSGIVRSIDNFGTTGDAPTHPDLLDDLATDFVDRGWSIKTTVRRVVESHAYRQSSRGSTDQLAVDPENRRWSHQNRRRLDAECLLDAILTISQQRDDTLGGTCIDAKLTEDYGYRHRSHRRAAYWPVFRNALPELLETFDFADPSVPTASRDVSTVAPQSLFFLNNPWVKKQSRFAAERPFLQDRQTELPARVSRLFQVILGRSPTPSELKIAMAGLPSDSPTTDDWTMLVQALLSSIEFRYVE